MLHADEALSVRRSGQSASSLSSLFSNITMRSSFGSRFRSAHTRFGRFFRRLRPRQRRNLAEEALSTVSRNLIDVHESERTWLARELHDDITQRLCLI